MGEKKSVKNQPLDRIIWLDAVKGLGVILVVFSHMNGIPVIGEYLFACFMPLFFIVSGYTCKRGENVKTYLYKRACRLLIPYGVYGGFLLLVKMRKVSGFREALFHCGGHLYSRYYLFTGDAGHNIYFLVSGNSAFWFLTAFFIGSILVLPLLKEKDNMKIVMVYVFLTVVLNYLPVLLPWSIDMGFLIAVFIWFGVKAREMNFSDLREKSYKMILLAGGLFYVFLVRYNGHINMSVRRYGERRWSVLIFILIGILGTGIMSSLYILTENFIVTKWFAEIGKISLTIMCLHIFIFSLYEKTLGKMLCKGYFNDCLKLGMVLAVSLLLTRVYRIFYAKCHLAVFRFL